MREFEFGPFTHSGSPSEVWEYVESYFEDRVVSSLRFTKDGWLATVNTSENFEHYVDPKLSDYLDHFNMNIGDLPFWYRYSGSNHLTTLFDSWSLLNWSSYLSKQHYIPQAITILHADAHEDLMSPRLEFKGFGEIFDTHNQYPFTPLQPNAVSNAIINGSIGIGSYILPIFLLGAKITIRHLDHKKRNGQNEFIQPLLVRQSLDPLKGYTRLKIEKVSREPTKDDHRYEFHTDPYKWAAGISDETILFHIDADYFLNRYNGCSTNISGKQTLDERLFHERLNLFMKALESQHIINRLSCTSLALSPSFFPVEFWEDCILNIHQMLGLEWEGWSNDFYI